MIGRHHQSAAVGRHGESVVPVRFVLRVPLAHEFARRQFDHADGLFVVQPIHRVLAVGRHGQGREPPGASDLLRVGLEVAEALAVGRPDEAELAVPRRDERLAVGQEGDQPAVRGQVVEAALLRCGRDVPDAHQSEHRPVVDQNRPTIGRQSQQRAFAAPSQPGDGLPRAGVEEADLPVVVRGVHDRQRPGVPGKEQFGRPFGRRHGDGTDEAAGADVPGGGPDNFFVPVQRRRDDGLAVGGEGDRVGMLDAESSRAHAGDGPRGQRVAEHVGRDRRRRGRRKAREGQQQRGGHGDVLRAAFSSVAVLCPAGSAVWEARTHPGTSRPSLTSAALAVVDGVARNDVFPGRFRHFGHILVSPRRWYRACFCPRRSRPDSIE
jgi:hypothetical protein